MIPKELMEQLRAIEIRALKAGRNHLSGNHLSRLRGRGFEFDQHKPYQKGDDYRQIDWNVTARMQHPYVKRNLEEKEMSALIMADLSGSMDFATVAESKRDLLLLVAAALAFSVAKKNMRVGLLGFTDRIEVDLPPKKGLAQVWKILEAIWDARVSSRATDFTPTLEFLDIRLKRPTLLFCISDFITSEDIFASNSFHRLAQRHDFVPLIIEDSLEETLPQGRGHLRLRDAESGHEMLLRISQKQSRRYESLMRERKITLKRSLYRLNLNHLFLRAGEPYLDLIIGFFLTRRRAKGLES